MPRTPQSTPHGDRFSPLESRLSWRRTWEGTADAITLTPTTAITAYATGTTLYRFFVKTENTGAVTLAVSGLAAVAIQRQNGTALASGELSVGQHLIVVYDGAAFRSNVTLETNHVLLTQAAYDALTPESDTVYFSTG